MDAVIKHDCSKRMEASFHKDVVNRKIFYSSSAKELKIRYEQSGVVDTPADRVICPECREKLKDMDTVMMCMTVSRKKK
ncbi:hypothetical protein TNCT_473041 [Trichonephila clavata]|uniref:Uncharacterized protein n=1 Tax=Trichonephila clavata TaxID=2740835 RepID=A0A8X6LJH2_TRICU|nr:hypothetical protein TNCT_473041 [Trichonephila clavata]